MNTSLGIRSNQTWLNNATVSGSNSGLFMTARMRYEIHMGTWLLGCITYFGAFVGLLLVVGAWPKSGKSGKSGFDVLVYHFIVLHFCMNLINTPSNLFLSQAAATNQWIPADICLYIRPFYTLIEVNINVCDAEMAINRVVALFFPHHYAKWTSKPVIAGMIIFSWLICVVGYFIPIAHNGIYTIISMSPLGVCIWSTVNSGVSNIVSFALLFGVPYAVAGIAAILLVWKNMHVRCFNRTAGAPDGVAGTVVPTRAVQRRLRKSRMLLYTFIWTGVCLVPGNTWAYGGFPPEIARDPMVQWWMKAPRTVQFSLTPCILLFYNEECRARLRGMLRLLANRIPSRFFTVGSLVVPVGSAASGPHSKDTQTVVIAHKVA